MTLLSDLVTSLGPNTRKRRESGETGVFKFSFGRAQVSRTSIINHLAGRIEARRYLEIGVRDGDNFERVRIAEKTGVDPAPKCSVTHRMTSDEFFANGGHGLFDIVFIDGMHLEEFVCNDIENSLRCLGEGGFIIVHDCNPPTEFHQRTEYKVDGAFPPWNGTVWRGWLRFRTRSDLSMCVVNTDYGVGVIRHGRQTPISRADMTYAEFAENRRELLPLISVRAFLSKYR